MSISNRVADQSFVHSMTQFVWLSVMVMAMCVLCLVWTQQQAHSQTIDDSAVNVKIKENKFIFDGHVLWSIDDGEVRPRLSGELDLKDAGGLCGRMRMDFYAEGHVLLLSKYGGEVCAKGDSRQSWSVSLDPYDSNKLNEIKVSIEKKTASKDWTIIGSETVKLKPIHHKVKITEDGFDFGGKSFALGAPTGSGDVTWSWSGGKITPRVTGTMHINNAASACARLQIKYFSLDGDLLETKVGGKFCASDNSHWYKNVDLSKYSDWKIASIQINLQTLGSDNSWRTVGKSSSRYTHVSSNSSVRLTGGRL
ncbi:MAG: hypothetical protein NPIRA01_38920 [Nitrospirales bacterium]|nr:MAG: hypothetical protein NPIRA01_38920 [Nitrospirales bacterium]